MTRFLVPHRAESAAVVRRRLADELTAAGTPEAVVDDVKVVVTELVANAIRHGAPMSGEIAVSWELGDGAVTMRVTDGGGVRHPTLVHAGPDQSSGRGLSIVDALSSVWGVDEADGRTTVWASVPIQPSQPGRPG